MSTMEELTAENEALKAKNADLTQQAKQLIGDLSRYRGGAGTDGRPNAALPPLNREAFDKLSPWEQGSWARGGGRISG